MALLFRAILFLFVVRLAGIVLRAFFGGFRQGAGPAAPSGRNSPSGRQTTAAATGQIEELVKDPVCGVHTARSTAIPGRYQGLPAYFCSPECAAKAN